MGFHLQDIESIREDLNHPHAKLLFNFLEKGVLATYLNASQRSRSSNHHIFTQYTEKEI